MLRFSNLAAVALLMIVASCVQARAQEHSAEFVARLKGLPHVVEVNYDRGFYDIAFEQPVDHTNEKGPKFRQHVFLSHSGFDKPVLLFTEGYAARRPGGGELKHILGEPNVITVEHRYFGRSMPSPVIWKHLTVKNAADDMHVIVNALKKIYSGKWVATGTSKGGQTALFYKCYYPHDMDATVAYVAPINLGQEDPRINRFIETVGDEAIRQKIKAFQIALLKGEDRILPLLKVDPQKFSLGVGTAFEYGVLEIPYAFWQEGANARPDAIPASDASDEALAEAFKRIRTMYYYSNTGIKQFEAFQYQAFTEIGYYNYDIADFKPFLKYNPSPTNLDICPAGTKDTIMYNPATMAFVCNFLQYKAQNVVFVYGETDTWSSTQIQLLGRTNSIKVIVKGAWHNASIGGASPDQKELVYSSLENWLGMKLARTQHD